MSSQHYNVTEILTFGTTPEMSESSPATLHHTNLESGRFHNQQSYYVERKFVKSEFSMPHNTV